MHFWFPFVDHFLRDVREIEHSQETKGTEVDWQIVFGTGNAMSQSPAVRD